METQNLVISFDYSWFLAENLAYAECPIKKFHYRNSSNVDIVLKKYVYLDVISLEFKRNPCKFYKDISTN